MGCLLFKRLLIFILISLVLQCSSIALADHPTVSTDKASYNPGETTYISINETSNVTAHVIDPLNRTITLALTPSESGYLTEYSSQQGVVLGTYTILVSGEKFNEISEFDLRTLSISSYLEPCYPVGNILISGNIVDTSTQSPVDASLNITIDGQTMDVCAIGGNFSTTYVANTTGQKAVSIVATDNENVSGTWNSKFEVYSSSTSNLSISTDRETYETGQNININAISRTGEPAIWITDPLENPISLPVYEKQGEYWAQFPLDKQIILGDYWAHAQDDDSKEGVKVRFSVVANLTGPSVPASNLNPLFVNTESWSTSSWDYANGSTIFLEQQEQTEGPIPYAYISNHGSNTVSVIDLTTNTVTDTVNVGTEPYGVAVNDAGTKAYVTNAGSNTVSVIDTVTNTVTATVNVGSTPEGVAVSSDGTKVYVANYASKTVSVINTATNTVTATVSLGTNPEGIAVNPAGTRAYVTRYNTRSVSVINTTTNTVTATVSVGNYPGGVAVNPAGTRVYVTNYGSNSVSVINATTNTVTATVNVGTSPYGIVVSPDGTKVYVTNFGSSTVSVIDTATNTVTATVNGVTAYWDGIAITLDGTKVYVPNYYDDNVFVIDTATNNITSNVSVGTNPCAFGKFIGYISFPLTANFRTNVTSGYAPLTVRFTDLSKNATARNWNFGDGTNSTEQNPTHTYSAVGTYTVNLTVSNGNDTDSKLAKITVLEQSVQPEGSIPYAYISNYGSNTVSVIDLTTDTVTDTVDVGSSPYGVAVNDAGTKVYVTNTGSNDVSVIDTVTNNIVGTVDVGSNPVGVAVAPDGTRAYVTNYNSNTVSVIDTATNTVIATVTAGSSPEGVAVHPGGTQVYVVNYYSNDVSVIDTATNTVTATVNVGSNPEGVAVNPTGTRVYVANERSDSVSVIDTATNTVTATVSVGTYPYGVAVSPDGTKVYVTNYDSSTVSVIDTATNTVTATVNRSTARWGGIAFAPNGTKVYVPNYYDDNVLIIDTATNNITSNVSVGTNPGAFGKFIGYISFPLTANFRANVTSGYAPLSVRFTDLSKNATARNWNFGDGTNSTEQNPTHTYSTVGTYTVNLTVSNGNDTDSKLATITVLEQQVQPEGTMEYAYISNYGSNTVSVIDLTTDTVTDTVDVGYSPYGVAVNDAGTKVYVTNTGSNDVSVIDTVTNNIVGTVDVGSNPVGVAVTPDGTRAYVTNYNSNTVSVIDTATNTVIATVTAGSSPEGVAVHPGGTQVYVVNYYSNNVSVIDTATNTVTATVNVGSNPEGVAVNPTGTRVYVANERSNSVSVIDTATNTVTATVSVGTYPYGVAVSPDGTKVYVTNFGSSTVSVIDTATNTVTATVNGSTDNWGGIAFASDGTKVYVPNYNDDNVLIIDTATNNITSNVSVGTNPGAFGKFIGYIPFHLVANFRANVTSSYAPLTVRFTDLSTNATSWNWNFGDGTYSTEQDPTHTYSAVGDYTVNLTVSNGNDTDSKLATINVYNRAPILSEISSRSVNESQTLTITLSATDPDGDTITYGTNATFGNLIGNIFTWTPQYDDSGIYYVEFEVSDGSLEDTQVVVITVNNINRAPMFIPGSLWWDEDYQYLHNIVISTGSTVIPSGYSVSFTFDHASLVSSGKAKSDGSDLRVLYIDGSNWTELHRVLDESSAWNSSSTRVWFRSQKQINASDSDNNYYLCYGNPAATSPPANPMNVYLFYDGFPGSSVNTSKWTVTGTASVASGILTVGGNSKLWGTSSYSFGLNNRWEARVKLGGSGKESYYNYLTISNRNTYTDKYIGLWTGGVHKTDTRSTSILSKSFTAATPTEYHVYSFNRVGNKYVNFFQDGVAVTNHTTQIPIVNMRLLLWNDQGTYTMNYDWIKVRKYLESEPLAAFSEEEIPLQFSPRTVNESQTLTISLHAVDPDGEPITYGTNATFGNLTGNVFTWTPGYDDSGVHYVEFNASDGLLSDSQVVTINVNNVNRAPNISAIGIPAVNGTMPDEQWNRTFDFGSGDDFWSTQQTSDGGYIAVGSRQIETGYPDISLIKTDSSGNEEWNKTFGGSEEDYAHCIRLTDDGGYIIVGGTKSFGSGQYDVYLIKTDASGNEQWNKTFGGSLDDLAFSIQQLNDGGYIIAGGTSSYGLGLQDAWLIRTNSSGSELWNQTFGGTNYDWAWSALQTNDGGYVFTGYTGSFAANKTEVYLVKVNSSGYEEWNETFGLNGCNIHSGFCVQQTSDGGYIISGRAGTTSPIYTADLYLIKTNSSGNEQWNQTFGGPSYEEGRSIQQLSDGGYIIAGTTSSYGSGSDDAWLLRTDFSGNEVWNKTFGWEFSDFLYSIQLTNDGGYLLAGSTELLGGDGGNDAWMIKIEQNHPVVSGSDPYMLNVSELLNLTILASDLDSDMITYNTNATFGELRDNVFTWTPGYNDSGVYHIKFSVSDGSLIDDEVVVIIVNSGEPLFTNFSITKTIEPGISIDEYNITLKLTSLIDTNMTDVKAYDIIPVSFTIADPSPNYNGSQDDKYYWNIDLAAGESKNITYVLTGTGKYCVTDLFNVGVGHS